MLMQSKSLFLSLPSSILEEEKNVCLVADSLDFRSIGGGGGGVGGRGGGLEQNRRTHKKNTNSGYKKNHTRRRSY